MQIIPTVARLTELLHYCPSTGELTWKVHRNSQARLGQEAGHISIEGYCVVGIDRRVYQAHRLAWAVHYGDWPRGQIDHINHVRTDNRICNLREVTHTQNQRNRSRNHTNTSGITGVYNPRPGKWLARICVDRQQHNLGTFGSKAEAVAARKAAETLHNYHINHGL